MLGRFGVAELLIIAFLLVLFFGGKKIPEFIRGLGEAVREFKKGAKEEK
ncbi:translocase [Candidatus Woesebacteria bacterium RIFCSPLOWO2_01_FULL_39_23]|uniref:Sec-independent protein translocase protein TatA n=1 Tax=Candidatus Woesebacteria bacterium RIFCSPHIGHO2_01_FULL_40_22 TaxID=1802499 RepID=A0A1F7YG39_9BACT|nr:MAG: translocase [Candidatus Woesebacteria bacterium RBG_16_40_11]OGM26301.1 MAG: translocase [Candidatus Woesebacteria bacterium RIFCSPHIGHO2_01_FULL_40_22]OGM35992.1 MAG: translocase [Candidatus Woesebacteria bacterium RIFCSPHIGHO2_12_FULL_38_9]OGM62856.1 MAG: translocase [Candidatus Woesebacteria bacterium RIFCSPLOWO2_01_FULL_39_23]